MKHLHKQRSAAEQAALRAELDRLEWKAWSILLWGLDAGDPKVIRFYLDTFRRLPDGSVRARPLPQVQPPAVKPIRPPTVKKLIAQDRRRAREAARIVAAEAIVADVHARGAETYAALAAVLPRWRQPPSKRPNHRGHLPRRRRRIPARRGGRSRASPTATGSCSCCSSRPTSSPQRRATIPLAAP